MTLTKQQALENHRKMWNWIADETLRQKKVIRKDDYFEAMGISIFEAPFSLCYCCGYVKHGSCKLCPVVWDDELDVIYEEPCLDPDSVYTKWCDSKKYKEAAKYARMIAELPERRNDDGE